MCFRGVEVLDFGGEGMEMVFLWVVLMDFYSKYVILCLYFFLLDLNIGIYVLVI